MAYCYLYPRPMVTVDIFLLRFNPPEIEILLIKRDHEPFREKWALPGGFIEMDETLIESAKREMFEETSLKNIQLFELGTAGEPGRDPRGRTISIIFGGIVSPPFPEVLAGDDARQVNWFSLKTSISLAFDHEKVIQRALKQIKTSLICQLQIFRFFPDQFLKNDLKILLNCLFGSDFSAPWFLAMGIKHQLIKKIDSQKFQSILNHPPLQLDSFLEQLEIPGL
jgi:8-oxo-dGTP diphosphatase